MGVKLVKYACATRIDVLESKLASIAEANPDLIFHTSNSIPLEYIPTFVKSQNAVAKLLMDLYNEEIEIHDKKSLAALNGTALNSSFSKIFSLVIDRSNQQVIGRLDATKAELEMTLETLFINEAYRGRKLGKWLVGSTLTYALRNFTAFPYFETNVDIRNNSALRLLHTFGFFHRYSIPEIIKNRDNQ